MANPYIADGDTEDSVSRIPDWREILAILMERAWIGLTVAALVFSYFYIQLKRTVPQYRSTAVLMVESSSPQIMNYQSMMSGNMRSLEYFNTVISTLHSRSMMEQVVQQEELATNPNFFPGVTNYMAKVSGALGMVSIQPVDKSRLINITTVHTDPQVACDLANAMAHAYIQQDLDSRMNTSMQALDWLRDKSDEFRVKLEVGLGELQQYREDAESVSLENDQDIVIGKLQALNGVLTGAQTDCIEAKTEWEAIQSQLDRGMTREQVVAQLNDEGLMLALSSLRSQQQSIIRLRQRYKEAYPELQEAIEVEQVLCKEFEDAFDLAVASLRMRYETLLERERGLQAALDLQEQEAFELSRQLVRYDDLKRNVEADQQIYQSMIERMKEASVAGSLPTDMIRIAEKARVAGAPFSPDAARSMMRGIMFGVALGVGAIFALYYSDHRLRRNEEVERALGVPVLTSLPHIVAKSVHGRGVACHEHRTGEVPEAFRTLRTILQVNPVLKETNVFLVTSTQPSEGKSLVATNLSISFSQDGHRTLLIGGDLRRPAFKQVFGVDQMPLGLSDVLQGKVAWEDTIDRELVPGLDLLPAGTIPSDPAELLGTPRMGELMQEFREKYDYVIIDSSPMMGISDSLLLMRHTDGVLFVVRQGVSHSLGATHAMKRILESGTPCLGALMNGVNLKSLANYYYYRRYGGYDYRKYQKDTREDVG